MVINREGGGGGVGITFLPVQMCHWDNVKEEEKVAITVWGE